MAAADARFFGDKFLEMKCTLEAKTSVRNLTQYKLFIGEDKKYAFWSDLLLKDVLFWFRDFLPRSPSRPQYPVHPNRKAKEPHRTKYEILLYSALSYKY